MKGKKALFCSTPLTKEYELELSFVCDSMFEVLAKKIVDGIFCHQGEGL